MISLHGWAQSEKVWFQQPSAMLGMKLHHLHLPGHGNAEDVNATDWITHLGQQIITIAQGQAVLLMGWSLGGQLAMALEQSLRPHNIVQGLVVIASTPCFRQQADWQHGCPDKVWQGFEQAVAQQDIRVLPRFFQLMLHGDLRDRKQRHILVKHAVNRDQNPSWQGLTDGLSMLSNLDIRHNLANISVPTLIFHGHDDAIIPLAAAAYLAEHLPASQLHVFKDCGHAPFLTHHVDFHRILESWCQNISM